MPRHRILKKAFTLVELLVGMAIMSTLAAMLLPYLQRSLESARRLQCLNNMRQVAFGVSMYANDYNGDGPHFRGHRPWYTKPAITLAYLNGARLSFGTLEYRFGLQLTNPGYIMIDTWQCPKRLGYRTSGTRDGYFDTKFYRQTIQVDGLTKIVASSYMPKVCTWEDWCIATGSETMAYGYKVGANPGRVLVMELPDYAPYGKMPHSLGFNVAFEDAACKYLDINPYHSYVSWDLDPDNSVGHLPTRFMNLQYKFRRNNPSWPF